ncbi:MAG: hypothetical protein OEV92_13310, partial [Nitrospinota bacterium]|nr:hypothetical protein [Nitrospinota bacterium]
CLALKRNPKTRNVPVYLLTSALLEYDLQRAERAGADGKMEKPFRSEEIVRKTLKIISQGPSGKAPLEEEEVTFEEFGEQVDWLLEDAERQMMEEEMEKVGPAVKKAVEEMAAGGELARIVEAAVDSAVEKRLSPSVMEEAVSRGLGLAMEKLRPEIMDQVARTTRQEAIRVAEELVKKAIGQIKKGEGL